MTKPLNHQADLFRLALQQLHADKRVRGVAIKWGSIWQFGITSSSRKLAAKAKRQEKQ